MRKYFKILIVIGIVIINALSFTLPCFAIGDPSQKTINYVDVYENCLENGDALFTIDFTVDYTVTPTEPISSTFIVRLTDSAGNDIRDSLPYAYFDNGYAQGYCSIYFDAADVITYFTSLTQLWADLTAGNYYMRLDGNPQISWTGGSVPSASQWSSSAFTLKASSTIGTTQSVISADIVAEAITLQNSWGSSSYILTITAVGGTLLSSQGTVYFGAVLPNLSTLAPNASATVQEELNLVTTTPSTTTPYSRTIGSDFSGTPLDLSDSASALHVGGMWLGIILTLAIDAFVTVQAVREINSYKPFVLLNLPLLYVFTRIGWFPMWLTVLFGIVALFIIWYIFFFEKSSS